MTQAASIAALALRAGRLLQQNNIPEALQAFKELVSVRIGEPDDWFNLGYLYRCVRRFDDALSAYRQALRLGATGPEEVHVNCAAILQDHMDRPDDALNDLEAALAINPSFLPAWLNLGHLHEDCGRPDDARMAYRKAIEIDETCGRAHARLAAIDGFQGEAPSAVNRLRQTLCKPGLVTEDAAEMQFALGHALDKMGDYDNALAAFIKANRMAWQLIPPSKRYDPKREESEIAALKSIFAKPVEKRNSHMPSPIFVCGLFRSGSTLTEQILSRHSRVTAGGEIEIIPDFIRAELSPYPQSMQQITATKLANLNKDYVKSIRKTYPEFDIIVDKRPDNFRNIGLIKSIFPESKIVYTKRNIIDNIISIYFLHFTDAVNYGFRIEDIIHYVNCHYDIMNHWLSIYSNDIYILDYDKLVKYPNEEIPALIAFCGLKWEEKCLSANRSITKVRTASNWQVRQPLYSSSSGRWKNYTALVAHMATMPGFQTLAPVIV